MVFDKRSQRRPPRPWPNGVAGPALVRLSSVSGDFIVSTRLRKFIELPASERHLLGSAVLAIVKARLSLTLVPIRQILEPVAVRNAPDGNLNPARIGWAVETAACIVPTGRNCLVRAIAGRNLLARHGFPSRIRIGIGKNSPDRLM